MLLDEATMPDAAVIAAGAALAGDVPALAISVGNPARVIRMRGEEAESESASVVGERGDAGL